MSQLVAGVGKVDITPSRPVWMDGMIRSHRSEGVHDPIYARALYLAADLERAHGLIIASVEVCALDAANALAMRRAISRETDVPADRIIVAATHTHSGPATHGFFNPTEDYYISQLTSLVTRAAADAADGARPAAVTTAAGEEHTISNYRRLLARDGHVIMNWEPYETADVVEVLGEPDPDVGLIKIQDLRPQSGVMCMLFTHAGHPNVMSGENYLISSDYPGHAAALLESGSADVAVFLNGAQGSVDIDGLRHRDWEGVERAGAALADAVLEAEQSSESSACRALAAGTSAYSVPARKISDDELAWAEGILSNTAGSVQAMADGMGNDCKALLFRELRGVRHLDVELEQTCFALDDTAYITFPGELFTEIGMKIKNSSPFSRTYVVGLANGYMGYVPTRQAIAQGGYEPDARRVDESAEDIIFEQSVELLKRVHDQMEDLNG